MRRVFLGSAALLLLTVLAQFFFAATGGFSTGPREDSYAPHHILGYVIFILALVVAGIGALARVPGRLIGAAALIAGLTAVQVGIAELAKALDSPLFFGLHALTGLAILGASGAIVRQARTVPAH